jgi:hypothetical protein
MREMAAKYWRWSAPLLVTTFVAGTFFAILGPFGAHRLGWPTVWLVWTGLIFAGSVAAGGAVLIVERFKADLPVWAWLLCVAALISVAVTCVLVLIEAASGDGVQFGLFPVKFFNVFVISAAIVTVARLVEAQREVSATEARPAAPPSFLRRIPAKVAGGDLYAVSAADHYLRVHTSRGDDLILMRLSDALEELEAMDGMRVHRSWWVARTGVERVKRDGDKLTIVLRNGADVPVARANNRALRRAGWV